MVTILLIETSVPWQTSRLVNGVRQLVYMVPWALAHPGMGMVIISTFSWKGFNFRLMGCPMKKDDAKLTTNQ